MVVGCLGNQGCEIAPAWAICLNKQPGFRKGTGLLYFLSIVYWHWGGCLVPKRLLLHRDARFFKSWKPLEWTRSSLLLTAGFDEDRSQSQAASLYLTPLLEFVRASADPIFCQSEQEADTCFCVFADVIVCRQRSGHTSSFLNTR